MTWNLISVREDPQHPLARTVWCLQRLDPCLPCSIAQVDSLDGVVHFFDNTSVVRVTTCTSPALCVAQEMSGESRTAESLSGIGLIDGRGGVEPLRLPSSVEEHQQGGGWGCCIGQLSQACSEEKGPLSMSSITLSVRRVLAIIVR